MIPFLRSKVNHCVHSSKVFAVVFLCYEDERWKALREWALDENILQPDFAKFLVGVGIVLLCPITIIIQNILFSLAINADSLKPDTAKDVFKHIINNIGHQMILIYDKGIHDTSIEIVSIMGYDS